MKPKGMTDLALKTSEDEAIIERIASSEARLQQRTLEWSAINTGSHNKAGLEQLAPVLADAFSALDADVRLEKSLPFENVDDKGRAVELETGPVIRVKSRPDAPVQIIMSGHYDTVFPEGTFTEIRDLGEGRMNGPGLADMKGGLSVMLGALEAFDAGPLKDRLGYQIVITPDEEIGNFASAGALKEADRKSVV